MMIFVSFVNFFDKFGLLKVIKRSKSDQLRNKAKSVSLVFTDIEFFLLFWCLFQPIVTNRQKLALLIVVLEHIVLHNSRLRRHYVT